MCAEFALEENTMMSNSALFPSHLRFLLPRYKDHQQISKIQRIVKYIIIFVAVSALFVITIIVHLPKPQRAKEVQKNDTKSRWLVKTNPCGSTPNGAHSANLECDGLDLSQGSEVLLNILAEFYQQGILTVNLILRNTNHKDNKISNGWLKLIENVHPKMNSLTLDNELLQEIEDYSFEVMPELTEIVLLNTNLKFLMRNAFKSLDRVWSFSLRGNKELQWVESGVLGEFSLTTLQIEGMNFEERAYSEVFIRNLTGNQDLSTVSILQFRGNKMPTFYRAFLDNFSQLVSLYLIQNAIQTFDSSSFTSLRQIKLVHVTQNEIKTFPEAVFGYLLNECKTLIYIDSNPIACDCSLEWLRESVIVNNLTEGVKTAKCASPEIYENELVLQIDDLCRNESTTESVTTNEPTSTVTEKPSQIECVDLKLRKRFSLISPEISLTASHNGSCLSVEETESSQDIQLVISSTNEHLLALAYVCRECSIKCQTVEKQTTRIPIHGLEPSTDYLFCVFGKKEILTGRVEIQDCLAYRTQPIMSERPWITNGDKNLTIVFISLAVFFVFFFGALIAFVVVRKRPTLLRGSGRVEVVKSRNGELVLVMPERKAAPSPSASSTYDTISGYVSLTPQEKTPPPLPPYPPTWLKQSKEDSEWNPVDREYLEPNRLRPIKIPRAKDLLIDCEWYTQNYCPK